MRPLSEKEIVEATVAFANGATLDLLDLAEHFPSRGPLDVTVQEYPLHVGDVVLQENERYRAVEEGDEPRTVDQVRNDCRRSTRESLGYIVREPMLAEDVEGITDQDLFPMINSKPYLRKVDNGLTLSFFYSFATDLDLVRLGEILLEDTERPYGKKLCQCELESCGMFFFEVKPPTGRPQRKYCCSEHMLKAHDLNAGDRMKKRRRAAARKK